MTATGTPPHTVRAAGTPLDSRSWTRHYDPGVPHSLQPYPNRTLLDYIADSAAEEPAAAALLFKGTAIAYRDLEALSDAFAVSLQESGVRPGDRVALLLPNCPQFIIAELGAWKAGAVVFPLNPLYTAAELAEPLKSSGAGTIVVLSPFYGRIRECLEQTSIKRILVTNIKEYLPAMTRLLFTLFKEKSGGHRIGLDPAHHTFQEYLARGAGRRPERASRPTPDMPALMLMSGGTTGLPKAVVGLHRHLVAAGLQLHAWLRPPANNLIKGAGRRSLAAPRRSLRSLGRDIALVPLPLFHVYASVGVQSHAFVSRTPLALVPSPRDVDDLLATIARVRPTLVSSVPALFIAMLNHPKVKDRKIDFTSIRACFSGAAPLLAETKKRFEELTGGRIVEGYSLTEAMMACIVNPLNGVNKTGSVGVPLPDVEVAIVDGESGDAFLPAGEVGEIVLRAPQLMQGYWKNPGETARALRTHGQGQVWLHTGDLGYLDPDDFLFIVDRKKDLIKTSGYQVWPREIEEVLARHPAVADVGVAGVQDAAKGEAVKAWVVRRPDQPVTADELRAYCRTCLAPFKVPTHIEFRESLPKTMIGKVLRRALVAEHQRSNS